METIRKPASVERAEFISSLVALINTSSLPAFVLESILKDIYNDVHNLAQKQYEDDLKRYNEAVAAQQ